MKKLILPLGLCLFMWISACQKVSIEENLPQPDLSISEAIKPLDDRPPLQKSEINRFVAAALQEHNEFRWDMVDDHVLWSAVVRTDSLVSIGYQPENFTNINERIHEIDVKSPEWTIVREALLNYILEQEQIARPDRKLELEDIRAFGEKTLPYINVQISSYELLATLRKMKIVRYAEPMGYGSENPDLMSRSGSGCGGSAISNLPSSDYTTVSPGAKVSWNYYNHNIPAAWAVSTGDNITVGVIDTGVSPNQPKLNSSFSSGWSTGRWRQKYGFFVTGFWWWASIDGPDDDCGHGNSMAGTIAAPRTSSGSTVGVAYKSNLVSVRGTDDVIIDESREKDGVSDAYVYLGNRTDVKVISMSLGDVFSSGQVADAVRYAHNRGKLIFAAAGTSLSWTSWWGVIFPANMSETVAVTGIKTGTPMKRCSNCHDGSAVDFVVTMQDRNNNDRTPITLWTSGNTPKRTGGSSVATATMAGMAALVWAVNPSQNRDEVLFQLKDASQYYPSRNSNFGWGQVDALQAVSAVQ